mmetsp:Transcript_15536/g.30061  ORF Transcript_15536/g.30061 Transcript_15536/m.30061 type:complete len:82 (+) Transcript_15536:1374-1619(+)
MPGVTEICVRLLKASAAEASSQQMVSMTLAKRGWTAGAGQQLALAELTHLPLQAVKTSQRGAHWSPVRKKGALGLHRILAR